MLKNINIKKLIAYINQFARMEQYIIIATILIILLILYNWRSGGVSKNISLFSEGGVVPASESDNPLPKPLTARIIIIGSGRDDGYLNFSQIKAYDSAGFDVAQYGFTFLTDTWTDASGTGYPYHAVDQNYNTFVHSLTPTDTFTLGLRAPANIKKIEIYNTRPGFYHRLAGATLQLLDSSGGLVASRTLTADSPVQTYTF